MAPTVSETRFALGTVAASGDAAETNTRAKYPRRGRPGPVTGGKGPRATMAALSPVSKTGATVIGSLDQLPYELAVGFTKYAHTHTMSGATEPGGFLLFLSRHEVERGARRDERFALDTLVELLDQTPEVGERPGVQVHVVVGFTLLGIREQIDDVRSGEW